MFGTGLVLSLRTLLCLTCTMAPSNVRQLAGSKIPANNGVQIAYPTNGGLMVNMEEIEGRSHKQNNEASYVLKWELLQSLTISPDIKVLYNHLKFRARVIISIDPVD